MRKKTSTNEASETNAANEEAPKKKRAPRRASSDEAADKKKGKSRADKKFEERFEQIRQALRDADESGFDDAIDDLLEHMTSSELECRKFLKDCSELQLKVARLVLDDVALRFADPDFLLLLKELQTKYPKINLSSTMDVTACEYAQKLNDSFEVVAKGERAARPVSFTTLCAEAEKGEPEALFRVALRYYFGSGVKPNYDLGRQFAEKACEQGYLPAALYRDLPRD